MPLIPSALTGLPTAFPSVQYRFIKALTAVDLDTQVERERAAIVAQEPQARCTAFVVMGGGAGAVFQVLLGFNTDGVAQTMPLMSDCTFAFAGAQEPSELQTETERVIVQAANAGLLLFGQDSAGGGAGAQFMAGYAFASVIPAPGGGGLLLQACTAGMEEQQSNAGLGLVDVEKEAITNPGVRLQCELPSVQASSALRFSWVVQTTVITVEGGGASGVFWRPIVSFPDDPIPDFRVTGVDLVSDLRPALFAPQGQMGYSFLWPISTTIPAGGPPTGRVQYFMQWANALGGDTIQLNGTTGSGDFGCPTMSLEEIANIVVQ